MHHRPRIHWVVDIVVFCLTWGVVGLRSASLFAPSLPRPKYGALYGKYGKYGALYGGLYGGVVPTEWIEELCSPA